MTVYEEFQELGCALPQRITFFFKVHNCLKRPLKDIRKQLLCFTQYNSSVFFVPTLIVCRVHIALPPNGKVTASSERTHNNGSSCQAHDGYIITKKAWCAKNNDGEKRFAAIMLSTKID